jgi:hypothetical protein
VPDLRFSFSLGLSAKISAQTDADFGAGYRHDNERWGEDACQGREKDY